MVRGDVTTGAGPLVKGPAPTFQALEVTVTDLPPVATCQPLTFVADANCRWVSRPVRRQPIVSSILSHFDSPSVQSVQPHFIPPSVHAARPAVVLCSCCTGQMGLGFFSAALPFLLVCLCLPAG
jgi:hypothetical protein